MKNKVLILGSEGFIGSHLVDFFRDNGDEVFSADIVLKQEPRYFLINPEIPDYSFLFQSQVFDVCINATGAANVQLSFNHPSLDFTLNTFNVYNLLDAIRQRNAQCKFVNLSSAAVYGNPKSLPIKETAEISPLSPYGYHKWYSEQICRQFYQLYRIPTFSVRIFSAYGVGLKKQLFWDVYQKIKRAESIGAKEIKLFGTGLETRDFIEVSDVCRAIQKIVELGEFNGGAMNVASGEETRIKDAVDVFVRALGANVRVEFNGEDKVGDPKNWRADVSLLAETGFNRVINLEMGLRLFAKWLNGKK